MRDPRIARAGRARKTRRRLLSLLGAVITFLVVAGASAVAGVLAGPSSVAGDRTHVHDQPGPAGPARHRAEPADPAGRWRYGAVVLRQQGGAMDARLPWPGPHGAALQGSSGLRAERVTGTVTDVLPPDWR